MRIDESIIFLKQRDDPLSTLQWGGYIIIILHIYNVNKYFLQGKRQKVSLP